MDHHDEELINCVRTRISKDEEVTRNKLHELCRIDYRTVTNHLDHIVNRDLGDGTKIVQGIAKYQALIKDPPGSREVVIEVGAPEDTPRKNVWEDFALGAIMGGLIVTSIALFGLALPKNSHTCSWVSLPGTGSWVRVCETCGRRGNSLNDQSGPIHFSPV
ncbi:hypothetical protein E6H34_00065 [Candidatus Bathyarchaeota archaeon]|nr:MAG: hypothetical protein E6H34_00065 [Candidatus Bathyarchaeota archaeon]